MKVTSFSPTLIGKRAKITGNTSGSGLKIGEYVYIKASTGSNNQAYVSRGKDGGSQIWVYIHELEFFPLTIDEIKEKVVELEAEIKKHQDMLEWMETQKLETFDEEVFKTWRIMKRLGLGSIEAAQDVVDILNS